MFPEDKSFELSSHSIFFPTCMSALKGSPLIGLHFELQMCSEELYFQLFDLMTERKGVHVFDGMAALRRGIE